MNKFLVIQTAFIGDVIMATAVVEKLIKFYPDAEIDFVVRNGNEGLLRNNPHVNEVIIWNKKENKNKNLWRVSMEIRRRRYDRVINLQRYFSTGLMTFLSGAKTTAGFDKNPLSTTFTLTKQHVMGEGREREHHEVSRYLSLIEDITDAEFVGPKMYPREIDYEKAHFDKPYVTMSPSSVWYTKQFHKDKWVELINKIPTRVAVILNGGPGDGDLCDEIAVKSGRENIYNWAGKFSFLQSAALMKGAEMNYVNDSAPQHMASAMNAPVTAIFCSTIPELGFGPLSSDSKIVEVKEKLSCRPCGLHGLKSCPEGHFKCSMDIDTEELILQKWT
ncbi:glycosyltransferase family 9 protein [Flammeovirga yaeyamensis]|uniref:Glycosyltransferase family 9 protein n=1 Tax=Flammeovirga yaeyamensis TaxID=367791 RepID=A0AAX1N7W9_9BACT|nr:glycosyltransferase family 9 protein [Flammeovirga yaeyamensis]MBB3698946.1 heptosyltransferase-2 [Flammeovirga yaeyamensis]NMF36380.1 glycosyltransferase family 9 protein [Flammeovirga yaeyamensis]QWG03659.1 glycosyltransferase family 9 protein [Flammeovirga yaeyamensis]